VRVAQLRITHRVPAGVGVAQNQPPSVCTAGLGAARAIPRRKPDSDFERWFLQRLKSAGYIAHPQVGVAKYRIDIGIVHPDKPGNYILGVECDGATYHSSKSARDRDRLREDVLIGLNWKIHRVWSTDWYRDPEREFTRLVDQIESYRESPVAS
jgi:very-short-patch-repair endonuclease